MRIGKRGWCGSSSKQTWLTYCYPISFQPNRVIVACVRRLDQSACSGLFRIQELKIECRARVTDRNLQRQQRQLHHPQLSAIPHSQPCLSRRRYVETPPDPITVAPHSRRCHCRRRWPNLRQLRQIRCLRWPPTAHSRTTTHSLPANCGVSISWRKMQERLLTLVSVVARAHPRPRPSEQRVPFLQEPIRS